MKPSLSDCVMYPTIKLTDDPVTALIKEVSFQTNTYIANISTKKYSAEQQISSQQQIFGNYDIKGVVATAPWGHVSYYKNNHKIVEAKQPICTAWMEPFVYTITEEEIVKNDKVIYQLVAKNVTKLREVFTNNFPVYASDVYMLFQGLGVQSEIDKCQYKYGFKLGAYAYHK